MIYRGARHHVVDESGIIFDTDVPDHQDLIGHNVDETIHYKDVKNFMDCLKSALHGRVEVCAYRVNGGWFLGRMERISSMRVRVVDVNVTDIDRMKDVIKIFDRTKTD